MKSGRYVCHSKTVRQKTMFCGRRSDVRLHWLVAMPNNILEKPTAETVQLIYDGNCPFCSAYVNFLRLREALGSVDLIDARTVPQLVADLVSQDIDPDAGMVLKIGDQIFHGADCIHALALMSSNSGLFNKFNGWVFRSPVRAHSLYPVLRTGRNLVLLLLGREKLMPTTDTAHH